MRNFKTAFCHKLTGVYNKDGRDGQGWTCVWVRTEMHTRFVS